MYIIEKGKHLLLGELKYIIVEEKEDKHENKIDLVINSSI